MASTRQGVFKVMPGAAPDIMRDYDLSTLGYEEIEYSLEGTAGSYELQGERGADGHWDVTPGAEAPFRTRFVARWPKDALRFSGTVVVEWHNVSAGIDAAPDWGFFHRSLAAAGHAWVGVSAQKVGIDGGGFVESIHLKLLAPERYKDLEHPGDAWSFDIFTQVGALLQLPADENPLVGLAPTQILAAGESQSAACLVTYINAVDPHAQLFDGFFVHGRPASGVSIDGVFIPASQRAGMEATRVAISSRGERIRDDARVPVLILQSETDVVLLGGGLAAQPDSDRLRTWEMAGAAHADTYTVSAGRHDDGTLDRRADGRALAPHEQPHDRPDGHAHQRRAAAALRGPGRLGTPRPVVSGWGGAAFGSQPRAQRRQDGLRPRRAGHRPGRDPHAVGRRADRRHWRASARAARPSPCSSAAPSPSTMPRWRSCTPGERTSTSNGSVRRSMRPSPPASVLEEDRMEILAVAAHSFPLRLAEG